jgi:hypothetical protein
VDETKLNGQEFTDEQLRAALKRLGSDARRATFAAGRPVVIVKRGSLVAVYADGTEVILEPLNPAANGGGDRT